MSTLKGLLFGVLVISASASTAPPAPVPPRIIPTGQVLEELAATQNFDRSVAEYVTLHRLLEMGVPPLRVTTDVREIQRAVRALALRIQVARVTARQGDLITPEVARMFRRRIATCLTPAEWQAIRPADSTTSEMPAPSSEAVSARSRASVREGIPKKR
jgi:hypothetical protein